MFGNSYVNAYEQCYGVASRGGYGVYDNKNKMIESLKYTASVNVKCFYTLAEAKEWAYNVHKKYHGSYAYELVDQDAMETNWFYRRGNSNNRSLKKGVIYD